MLEGGKTLALAPAEARWLRKQFNNLLAYCHQEAATALLCEPYAARELPAHGNGFSKIVAPTRGAISEDGHFGHSGDQLLPRSQKCFAYLTREGVYTRREYGLRLAL